MKKNIVTGKPELLKKINRNMIIKLIIKHKTISRSQLANMTKLALPSVMRIVDSLIKDGLVIDIGKGESTGGRKPNLICLNSDALYIFGVEIAVNTEVVLTNLDGTILEKKVFEQNMDMKPEDLLEKVVKCIEKMKRTHSLQKDKIAGIGIGTPGTNFKYIREVERAILKGWESFDVKAWFVNKTDYMVQVENVARTRTLNELWFGHGKSLESFIYVFVDRGVGCGIVNNGVIFKGAKGVAGEFGHTTIELDGHDCYCGKKGCIEMYVSAGAITNRVCERLNLKTIYFPDLKDMQDDPEVNDIFKQSGRILGVGIANLINIYNPQAIIIGGEVPLVSPLFADAAVKSIDENVFNKNALETPVLISQLDHSYACLGSVALVIDKVFESVEL